MNKRNFITISEFFMNENKFFMEIQVSGQKFIFTQFRETFKSIFYVFGWNQSINNPETPKNFAMNLLK